MRILVVFMALVAQFCFGQTAPTHLMTDLLEHTDRVFMDGYPTNLTLQERGTAIERLQTAAIRNAKPVFGWVMNSDKPNTLQT
ncbi:MAG: hypothetical protein LBR06_04965, partial [Bacteroidales bacterium]|nr:hypothetical protein [Bacteroidales bacterium]